MLRRFIPLCLAPLILCMGLAGKSNTFVEENSSEVVYRLPYASGKAYRVTQGYHGKRSHKGHYAVDWKMPEGTPVVAARGGVVLRMKSDSDMGGWDRKYLPEANFVSIRHEDGTIGFYCHLMKDGVLVNVGQNVEAGQVLAYSGNTGYSTGPHLHFSVLRSGGEKLESIPVKFKTKGGIVGNPKVGINYLAP
jgi:murein DD-endopeptidase MepM/ murein hydrolase activator NlpD